MIFLSLTSALIAAGITIPTLFALYFLKRKRQLMAVSSTYLWKKALQDLEVNAPFQRIRRNMLLLLQLFILLGLLFAFSRPALREVAGAGQRVVIVIDHSASMNTTDVSPSRLGQAKEQALQLIEDLGGSDAMVISFAQQTRVVEPFTSDRARLRDGIRSITATDQHSKIAPVLQLVEPFALKQAQPLVVYVISDGKVHQEGEMTLRGADLRFISVGKSSDNLGFIALGARRDYERPEQVKIFAKLTNVSDQAIDARVTLKVDSQVQTVDNVTVPAHTQDHILQFDLMVAEDAFIQLAHDYVDALAADNRVSLTIQPPQQVRVMLIGHGNRFLERAIRAAGPAELIIQTPEQFDVKATTTRAMDVLIFDRVAPRSLPSVDSLYLGCAPAIEHLKLTAAEGKSSMLDWKREHPLLRYVAMDDVAVSQQITLQLPDGATILGSAERGPMMALVHVGRVRHVVVGFDVIQSNWPMQISFPVFVTNAINWLSTSAAGDAGHSYQPGDVAVVDVPPGRAAVSYSGPGKLSAKAVDGRAILPAFMRVGMYFANGSAQQDQRVLSVNLVNARESDIRPADQLKIGSEAVQAVNSSSRIVRREVWPWFVWMALGVVLIEWVVYTRRMHL